MTREEIDRLRQAFVDGSAWEWAGSGRNCAGVWSEAAKRFPYPTQPRVVKCAGTQFRVNPANGGVQYRYGDEYKWYDFWNSREAGEFAAMLSNPTEDTP